VYGPACIVWVDLTLVSLAAHDRALRLRHGGRRARSLWTAAHPFYTRFTNIIGTSRSETTMRPNPRCAGGCRAPPASRASVWPPAGGARSTPSTSSTTARFAARGPGPSRLASETLYEPAMESCTLYEGSIEGCNHNSRSSCERPSIGEPRLSGHTPRARGSKNALTRPGQVQLALPAGGFVAADPVGAPELWAGPRRRGRRGHSARPRAVLGGGGRINAGGAGRGGL
jgi:hypothetical protein